MKDQLKESRGIRNYQRLWDLVRQMRLQLFREKLIDEEEYAELAASRGSVARLDAYDGIRHACRELTWQRDRLAEYIAEGPLAGLKDRAFVIDDICPAKDFTEE